VRGTQAVGVPRRWLDLRGGEGGGTLDGVQSAVSEVSRARADLPGSAAPGWACWTQVSPPPQYCPLVEVGAAGSARSSAAGRAQGAPVVIPEEIPPCYRTLTRAVRTRTGAPAPLRASGLRK
jgi:hypothetical protein